MINAEFAFSNEPHIFSIMFIFFILSYFKRMRVPFVSFCLFAFAFIFENISLLLSLASN